MLVTLALVLAFTAAVAANAADARKPGEKIDVVVCSDPAVYASFPSLLELIMSWFCVIQYRP